jgi:hypothetical protein
MKTALLVISLKNKVIDEALKGPISDALKRVGKKVEKQYPFYMWIFMVFHTLKIHIR